MVKLPKTTLGWQEKRRDSRHITISDWADAPQLAAADDGSGHFDVDNSGRSDNDNNDADGGDNIPVPEMDLSAIRRRLDESKREEQHEEPSLDSSILGSLDNNFHNNNIDRSKRDGNSVVNCNGQANMSTFDMAQASDVPVAHLSSLSSSNRQPSTKKKRTPSFTMGGSFTKGGSNINKPSLNKLLSFGQHKLDRRHSNVIWDDNDGVPYIDEDAPTVAPSSSASRTSYSSSGGTNIWSKLMGGGDNGLWDGLNAKTLEDEDGGDMEDSNMSCGKSVYRCGMAWWYESKHFFKTVAQHPHIAVISLLVFSVLCGVGMVAINSQRDQYITKQKMTAEFVASETAEWFSNQFRRAMVPLYSVQQGVVHSGYFDELPAKIGAYPNLVIPETEETPFTKRDVSGICDDPNMIQKWKDIVQPINTDNDLDGIVQGYRLFPANVACLTEPHEEVGVPADTKGKFDGMFEGEALLASDNVAGLDTGHTAFPLWKMITTDLFINKQFNIFGPFPMPPMTELICGHIAIWEKPDPEDPTKNVLDVHGTEVENAWGFVVNFLDWKKLKDKSNIYERFAGCNLEFQLSRKSGSTVGLDSEILAESPDMDQIDDANAISVETETMHGTWVNKVGRKIGWSPPWYSAAVAGVVLSSLLLGILTASTLVERQLHRNLLYKVMPRRAIAKLHRGQTVLDKYNLVTIFFSDIVGFTSMSGSMRPIQVMKMLNDLYMEFDKLVEKHQVYKVETIGDAYMVVGGAPDRVPAPLAAERVALFSIDAINLVKTFRTKDGDQIFVRAGLASGSVVAGVVGQAMPRYCFFGDTVNFASRMESTSKKMRIQCEEITYRLLMDAPNMNFTLNKRMEGGIAGLNIKGKGHQITYWIEKASTREGNHTVIEMDSTGCEKMPSKIVEEEEDTPQDGEVLQDEEVGNVDTSNKSDEGYSEFLSIISGEAAPTEEQPQTDTIPTVEDREIAEDSSATQSLSSESSQAADIHTKKE